MADNEQLELPSTPDTHDDLHEGEDTGWRNATEAAIGSGEISFDEAKALLKRDRARLRNPDQNYGQPESHDTDPPLDQAA